MTTIIHATNLELGFRFWNYERSKKFKGTTKLLMTIPDPTMVEFSSSLLLKGKEGKGKRRMQGGKMLLVALAVRGEEPGRTWCVQRCCGRSRNLTVDSLVLLVESVSLSEASDLSESNVWCVTSYSLQTASHHLTKCT